ncbi:XdhC family protein [Alkalicoccus urumqiensis]|uniref:Xanthine dehydrogenase n=1 Tax=Alkalicoccus urumqiensis TaxID=1548213 RepID=A0A2P6MLP2_ALKUR|nr:XdhC family protein [Alkalicoccus urumqiensis]PRO67178.1 xanthine dehydrogenase [Alkalicoccus urumqiensis]
MSDMHRLLKTMQQEGSGVLAAVIEVEGSAYRKAGAKMFFAKDGTWSGLISGGCVEEDLSYAAEAVLHSGSPQVVTYDLRSEDDLGWGQGAGCNGSIRVLLEPVHMHPSSIWQRMLTELENNRPVVQLKRTGSGEATVLYTPEGKRIGGNGAITLSEVEREKLVSLQTDKETAAVITEGGSMLIYECIMPKPKLYVFGAGRDAEPVVSQAVRTGWGVTVVDPSPNRLEAGGFTEADERICRHPEGWLQEHSLPEGASVLVMSHRFEQDQRVLQLLAGQNTSYCGVLGPRRRTRRLLGTDTIPGWITSPAGLDIQAEGEEEIAISMMAELIQVRRAVKQVPAVLEVV